MFGRLGLQSLDVLGNISQEDVQNKLERFIKYSTFGEISGLPALVVGQRQRYLELFQAQSIAFDDHQREEEKKRRRSNRPRKRKTLADDDESEVECLNK